MSDRIRIIDEITKSRGYSIALFTTFNFELDYFERAILNRLYNNGIRRISLFVDSLEFDKALSTFDYKLFNIGLGKKYVVSPVSIKSSFHPKMVLLLGDKKAKLIVSSANITTRGYERNNEIFNIIEYSENNPMYQDIIVSAINCFININDISYKLDDGLICGCKDFFYYKKCKNNGERYLINNMEIPIINGIRSIINSAINEIKIAVPYYDNDISALKRIKREFPEANIQLYIQQGTSTFSQQYQKEYDIVLFDGFRDINSASGNNFYHGKVFLFKTDVQDYILYGSANCTNSALFKTYLKSGNIESDLLDVGALGEFDEFFMNFHQITVSEIKSNRIVNDSYEVPIIRFIYAEITKEGIICYFTSKVDLDTNQVVFSYKGVTLKHDIKDKTFSVLIEKELNDSLPTVFDMDIKVNDNQNKIRCWVIDRYSLNMNRGDELTKDSLDDFDSDLNSDRFREDRYNLLKAELMCVEELKEYQKIEAVLEQQEVLDEDDEESDDEFIVDSEMHYEYKSIYKRYDLVNRIRGNYFIRFLHPMNFLSEVSDFSENTNDESYNAIEPKKNRRATTEEKRFERFVKRRVKGLINSEFTDLVTVEHYIGIIRVIFEIFYKYNNSENVSDIFDTEYVITTKIQLMERVISKNLNNKSEKELYEKRIIIWAICILLENRYLIASKYIGKDDYKIKSLNRDFLLELESKYNVRDKLPQFIKEGEDKRNNLDYKIIQFYGVDNAVSFIEDMYGYKDDSRLHKYIKDRYGNDTIIRIEKNNLVIEVISSNIVEALRPDVDVVREVESYNRNDKKGLKGVVFIITNGDYSQNRHIVSIKHTVSFDYHRYNSVINYISGKKEITPSSFLSY